MLHQQASKFARAETGAVTVEWVVMTAALVGMGMATMQYVSAGVEVQANRIRDTLSSIPIMTSFAEWDDFRENGIQVQTYVPPSAPSGDDGDGDGDGS